MVEHLLEGRVEKSQIGRGWMTVDEVDGEGKDFWRRGTRRTAEASEEGEKFEDVSC